ncbi:MAG: hypothetical protein IPP29_09035 [Bacteroidetes bacterium]|nr:hypothetical protein [Bacteroidota bacterium]
MNANIEWVKFFGGNNSGLGPRFCINENTGIYLAGGFAGQGVFDQFLLTGNSTSDLYIAKFNFNGSINWVQQANSSTISFGWSTASNKKDASVYVTGYFGGTAYFEDLMLLQIHQGTCLLLITTV